MKLEAQLPYEVPLSLRQIQLRFHPRKSLCWPGIFPLRVTERQNQLTSTQNNYTHLCTRHYSKSFRILTSSIFTTTLRGKAIITLILEIKKLRHKEMKHPASKSRGSSVMELGLEPRRTGSSIHTLEYHLIQHTGQWVNSEDWFRYWRYLQTQSKSCRDFTAPGFFFLHRSYLLLSLLLFECWSHSLLQQASPL